MVHEHTIGDVEYSAVYREMAFLPVTGLCPSGCIECPAATVRPPFVFGQPQVIIGVNNGEFALAQRYAAEGIAVANAAIEKYGPRSKLFQPNRNFNNDFNCSLPRELQKY